MDTITKAWRIVLHSNECSLNLRLKFFLVMNFLLSSEDPNDYGVSETNGDKIIPLGESDGVINTR